MENLHVCTFVHVKFYLDAPIDLRYRLEKHIDLRYRLEKHLTMAIIYINLNILLPIKLCVSPISAIDQNIIG